MSEQEMFTPQVKEALNLAQQEAERHHHNYIGTEHLLLGLLHFDEGAAIRILSNLGVERTKIRSAIEFILSRHDRTVSGAIGLTPRAKKVVQLMVDEAHNLASTEIGTEH